MKIDELQAILAAHKLWLDDPTSGHRADLSGSNLRGSNLSGSDLRDSNLRGSNLSGSNLRDSDLRGSNLRGSNLRGSNLSGSDLSGSKELLDACHYLDVHFEHTADGVIAYKRIGGTTFQVPAHWVIQPGQVLTEVCNPLPTLDCACGVNVGTREWCDRNYTEATLWRVLIRWPWLAGVVVPYNTDGKIRCSRVELVEVVT